jgi:helicase
VLHIGGADDLAAQCGQRKPWRALGDGAAGAVRGLIPAVVRVFAFLHPDVAVGDIAERTMARLELGPVELVELGMVFGSALTRAQYLSLLECGLTTPNQFEAADNASLAGCLDITRERVIELQTLLQERKRQRGDALTPLLPIPTE